MFRSDNIKLDIHAPVAYKNVKTVLSQCDDQFAHSGLKYFVITTIIENINLI